MANLLICRVEPIENSALDEDEGTANARLIAAAPELVEALTFALATIEYRPGLAHRKDLFTDDERARLRRALARVHGEEA